MTPWQLMLMTLLTAFVGCGSSDQKPPSMVEINDAEIEEDICAAVYFYASTVLELGRGDSRGQFRINGHLWRSFTPLTGDAVVVAEFSPADYTSREDISKMIEGADAEKLFFWINLDGKVPAEKLFLLMDFIEEAGLECWINPIEEKVESSIRVFAPPKTEAEQYGDRKPNPAAS